MAKKIKDKDPDKISRKDFRREIMEKLSLALAAYKQEIGEKKFQSRVKKASKLFSRNLGKTLSKSDRKSKERKMEGLVVAESVMG